LPATSTLAAPIHVPCIGLALLNNASARSSLASQRYALCLPFSWLSLSL
jgi:hypothetical protein